MRELLADLPARVVFPGDLGITLDVEEGESSFVANAKLKARAFRKASGVLTIGEDSGFEVDALNGEPGVVSARWGGSDYSIKNQRIIEMVAAHPEKGRGCRYVSVLAIATLDGRMFQRTGFCQGVVADLPAGTNGFGYDPIFFIPDEGKTMAQLDSEEKGELSHRGRAVRKALPLLRSLLADPDAVGR
jgi:XTP/dITP diphosphohydrolase